LPLSSCNNAPLCIRWWEFVRTRFVFRVGFDVYFLLCNDFGRLAQPVEQLTLNQRVTGSIPVSPINKAMEIENIVCVDVQFLIAASLSLSAASN
jgi:hypothetical protein